MVRIRGFLVELTSVPLDGWLLVFEEPSKQMGSRFSLISVRTLGWISDSDQFRLGELFMFDYLFGIFRLSLDVRRGLPNESLSFWGKLFEIVIDRRLLGDSFIVQAKKIEQCCCLY